ncbi:MAG: hypothetical protein AB1486_02645 [Planctomycetota bacterium]
MPSNILQDLRKAAKADRVCLHFRDGKVVEGAILFNELKQCGKIINIEEEFSMDFNACEIVDVKL